MITNSTTTTTPTTTTTAPTTATDLALVEKVALDKLNRSMAKNGLDALMVGDRQSLLLLDCSSSMGAMSARGQRRIDALRVVVDQLRATHPVPVAAFGGSNNVEIVDGPLEPQGSTPLDVAIDFGRQQGANHLVVVTDGEPNSQLAAFAQASAFGGPIDVFYIGDDPHSEGARFAAELARRTGGTCSLTTLDKPKELTSKIAGLLGDGGAL